MQIRTLRFNYLLLFQGRPNSLDIARDIAYYSYLRPMIPSANRKAKVKWHHKSSKWQMSAAHLLTGIPKAATHLYIIVP